MIGLRIPVTKRARAALLAAVIASGAAIVVAEDLTVQRDQVDVRQGPGLLFDPVETVGKSTRLQVLERTDDGWIKVQMPDGKQGYVFGESIKPAQTGGLFGGITSDAEASQMSTAAASKGLEPEAEHYARSKSYNKASLDQVIATNKSIKGQQWLKFCQDGKVGPAKLRGTGR